MLMRRARNCYCWGGGAERMKVEASVARCLRTPPAGAYPVRTLSIGITNRLRGLRYRSIVVVGNYGLVHHGGTIPGKSTFFTPSSILFRPRRCSLPVRPFGRTDPAFWDGSLASKLHRWSRRVLPPGPIGLLQRPFIAISGLATGTVNIGARTLRRKGAPSFRDGQRPGPESITTVLSVSLGPCFIFPSVVMDSGLLASLAPE
jgi:hypothetical protein